MYIDESFNPDYYRQYGYPAANDMNKFQKDQSSDRESSPNSAVNTPPPLNLSSPSNFEIAPGSPANTDILYTQGYLQTQIGKRVRVEFLVGTNIQTDRVGTLIGVGISYILLRPSDSDDILLCDIYSIKFVTVYQ